MNPRFQGVPLGALPSEESVRKLLEGDPAALGKVFASTLGRALIIGVPLAILKIEPWKVLVGALSASTLITLLVVIHAATTK